jgi:hypothetical protein
MLYTNVVLSFTNSLIIAIRLNQLMIRKTIHSFTDRLIYQADNQLRIFDALVNLINIYFKFPVCTCNIFTRFTH